MPVLREMLDLLHEAAQIKDLNLLVKLPRFEFIAAYLVLQTGKKENRTYVQGYQVKKKSGKWQVVQTGIGGKGGTVVYETDDAGKLFDYVRRGPLGYFTREADNLRADHSPAKT